MSKIYIYTFTYVGKITFQKLTNCTIPALCVLSASALSCRWILHLVILRNLERVTALFLTFLIIITTVTFLPFFNDLISAEGTIVGWETVCSSLFWYGIENQWYIANGALRKLVIVRPVSTGGRGEHNVVPKQTPRLARLRKVVRRAKVMTNLVSQRELRDLWRNSGVVVEECDYTGVEGPLLRVTEASQVLCIGLVLFTNTTRGTYSNNHQYISTINIILSNLWKQYIIKPCILQIRNILLILNNPYNFPIVTCTWKRDNIPDGEATQARPRVPPVKSLNVNT